MKGFGSAALAVVFATSAYATTPPQAALPECGVGFHATGYELPAGVADARPCATPAARAYRSRYGGLAYEILDLESEACFVPDESYRLLDTIVARIHERIDTAGLRLGPQASAADLRTMSEIVIDTIDAHEFALYVPTPRMAAALMERRSLPGEAAHIYDCDIGTIILLTIAEHYQTPASMVEIRLSEDATHNYVRFEVAGAGPMDWDTNNRNQCVTPANQPAWHGRAMSRDEAFGYILRLRAYDWHRAGNLERALQDRVDAMRLWPAHPDSSNDFAWFVATTDFPGRSRYVAEAQAAAERAVALERSGNYLDTLACLYALQGDYVRAGDTADEAVRLTTDRRLITIFRQRLDRFRAGAGNCTGDR